SSVLRKRGAPRELVLCDAADWACVVHEVRAGIRHGEQPDHLDRQNAKSRNRPKQPPSRPRPPVLTRPRTTP
ncbi:hypothetical protein AB0E54_38740, partial [Amycolatopsis coloradensis]